MSNEHPPGAAQDAAVTIELADDRALVFFDRRAPHRSGWSLREASGADERAVPGLEAALLLAPGHAPAILEALLDTLPEELQPLPGESAASYQSRHDQVGELAQDALLLVCLADAGQLALRLRPEQLAPALEGALALWRSSGPELGRTLNAVVTAGSDSHPASIEAGLRALDPWERNGGAAVSVAIDAVGGGYLQVTSDRQEQAFYADALTMDAGGAAVPSTEQRGRLEATGWTAPGPNDSEGSGGYLQTFELTDELSVTNVAALLASTMHDVFGADPVGELGVSVLDPGPALDSPNAGGELFIDLVDGVSVREGSGPLREVSAGHHARAQDDRDRDSAEGDDVGLDTLRRTASALQVDPEWTLWEGRAFTWWPHHAAQRMWADPPDEQLGDEVCAVWLRADVLADVEESEVLADLLDAFNVSATLSAWVLDPHHRTVSLVASARVHAQNGGFVHPHLSLAAAIQAADAEFRAPELADLVGGRADGSAHPRSGARPTGDDMLRLLEDEIVPAGRAAPLVDEHALAALTRADAPWRQAKMRDGVFGAVLTTGGPGHRRTQPTLAIGPQPDHPQLGAGLLVSIRIPEATGAPGARSLAAALNRLEAEEQRGPHLLGAWSSSHQGPGVQFAAFVPNYLLRGLGQEPAFYVNWAYVMAARARWAHEALATLTARAR